MQPSVIKGKSISTEKDLSEKDFEKACILYKNMLESNTYCEQERLIRILVNKRNKTFLPRFAEIEMNDKEIKELIFQNLDLTKFKSKQEAEDLLEETKKVTENY